ncbi:MAG: cytochrome c oxidase subunit II [Myxococcales bacterium]|nr:cytochrome c oxidase subunit II [Myxococcales bacterium]MCB9705319.1 cytochrome c oxidase subunit II [Myxococcales bacterium]
MILNLLLGPDPALLGTPQMSESPFSLLPAASTNAQELDNVYLFITALCAISFVILIGAQIYFMVKYKKPASGHRKTSPLTHSGKLEFWWSFIPAVLLIGLFAWGETLYMKMVAPPDDALQIRVTGQKWFWTVEYPDSGAKLTDEIIIPINVPVKLTLTSNDVIHSFYIPVFRQKKDAVPGRYTNMWFEATKVGVYPLFCAEYCGDQHSSMIGTAKVVSMEDFEAAIEEASRIVQLPNEPLPDYGARVFAKRGCESCHSVDGTTKTGPSLKGKYGAQETLADGSTVTIDDNYIRESLMEPNAKIVQGFAPQMPSFTGQLTDEQIVGLIEYIKSLK